MFSPEELERLRVRGAEWREKNASRPQRRESYKTPSQIPVEPVYTPEHLPETDYLGDVGLPGEYPYLRGIHATGYVARGMDTPQIGIFSRQPHVAEIIRFREVFRGVHRLHRDLGRGLVALAALGAGCVLFPPLRAPYP